MFTSVGVPSTTDGVLYITKEPADNELSLEPSLAYSDNRTGIALGSTVGNNLLNCEATRSGTFSSPPDVLWIKNGEVISNSTGFSSFLDISTFTQSDAGVYQCIFIDTDATAEVITTIPFRLDTGLKLYSFSCIV